MADNSSSGLDVKCTRCRQTSNYADAIIQAKIDEKRSLYKSTTPIPTNEIEIILTCPICGQKNAVTIRPK